MRCYNYETRNRNYDKKSKYKVLSHNYEISYNYDTLSDTVGMRKKVETMTVKAMK